MHDLREVYEMVTKQTEPDLDSWKKQEDRQRHRSRDRRIGAIVVAAAAAIAIGAFALLSRPGSGTTSVTNPPAPSVPFVTTPPIGAQLVAPDGSSWEWGPPDAADRITGTALDFALVVTQRRLPADTGLEITGADARTWIGFAQAFAGNPTETDSARGGM